MANDLHWIEGGGVTTPRGFRAGAAAAGIQHYAPGREDVAILLADDVCTAAGLFTRNAVVGEALRLTRERLRATNRARAIVTNTGNSNCSTGAQGAADANHMALLVARRFNVPDEEVLVGSTGTIGRPLPMDKIEAGIAAVNPTPEGNDVFARAIMTTDTRPKHIAVSVEADSRTYTVGGAAKGSGMVHPDLATMFGFLTTDAPVELQWLQDTLRGVCDRSFNMVDVDMDTSTCDMVIALASGVAGGAPVSPTHPAAEPLASAFQAVAVYLARELARDGEGARTLITATVEGAATLADARIAARTVTSSPLMKTAITGRDPNWGRVMMAVGRSGAHMNPDRTSVWIGDHCVFAQGAPTPIDLALVSQAMNQPEVHIRVDLAMGTESATAWGCDLTEDYVKINAEYST